jgi:hypothetical protein
MIPTWVGVVSALSLLIIALSALTVAASIALTTLGMRAALRGLQQLAGPAIEDVRQLIGVIRVEVDAVAATSRDVRGRIVRAADAAVSPLVQVMRCCGVQGSVRGPSSTSPPPFACCSGSLADRLGSGASEARA